MIWFITGASKGFGREFAIAALERGDRVAATARDTKSLAELSGRLGDRLLPLRLDVTDRAADFEVVGRVYDEFGGLDVVVNNAGYGHFGAVEELSEADLRDQLETNLFGAVWITQAALPFLRAQGSGHIIQVSSIAGVNAFPTLSLYHASKWALEGMSQALATEVAGRNEDARLQAAAGFDAWERLLADALDRMCQRGELRADAEPAVLATGLLASI